MHKPPAPSRLTLPLPEDSTPLLAAIPTPLPASMDFAALLAEGIGYAQSMASDQWSDYNEHDPGLTMLEQLCYALTELGMRGHYPVEDLLADADGQVGRQSLFGGERVLTTAALTVEDYRRLLYDRVIGLKNFWLLPVGQDWPGLYRGVIEVFSWADVQHVRAEARRLLRSHRSLGEDLLALTVLLPQTIALAGTVVLKQGGDVDEAMAAILFDLNLHLVPGPALVSRDVKRDQGTDWDAIYEGPLLHDGVIDQLGAATPPTAIELRQIARIVQGSAGVDSLAGLRFGDIDADHLPLLQDALPRFASAARPADWPFEIRDVSGARLTPDRQRVDRFMLRLASQLHQTETAGQHSATTLGYRRKRYGRQLDIGNYFSIQHQFPVTYGLSRYGVPANLHWQASDTLREGEPGTLADADRNHHPAASQRQAQARQLCAYLLLFEQMLANGYSQLAAARQLFAVRGAAQRSYFCQPLVGAQPGDGEAAQARYVLAKVALPPSPPVPAPARAGQRYQVQIYAPSLDRREPGWYSVRFADRNAARRLLELIRKRGMDAENYATAHGDEAGFTLELLGADGATLAWGCRRYAEWEQASAAAVTLAGQLREAHRHGRLGRYVRLRHQPAAGLELFLHGQVVLSAFWDVTLAERDALAEQLLRLGADPGNYRLRRRGQGWRYDLYQGRRPVARGHLYGADRDAAWQHCLDVAALLQQVGADPEAYLRHVALLPEAPSASASASAPAPLPASLDGAQQNYQRRLEDIVARFDDHAQRRHAFLDHMLARFDEGFDDQQLQDSDPRPANGAAFLDDLASWKSSFLAAYPHAGGRRGCGADYGRKLVHEMPFGSGLEHRLYSLLGIGGRHDFARYPSSRPRLAWRRPWLDADLGEHAAGPAFELRYHQPDLLPMLFEYGLDLARYRIRQRRSDRHWCLYFMRPDVRHLRLMAQPEQHDIEQARDRLIAWLARDGAAWQQMYQDEGLYVIEHILLRPLAPALDAKHADADFYRQGISVLFPAWPVRFGNPQFRQLAQSLLAQHGPAHLGCSSHWLRFEQMREFEELYACWSRAKHQALRLGEGAPVGELDRHSLALGNFLRGLTRPEPA